MRKLTELERAVIEAADEYVEATDKACGEGKGIIGADFRYLMALRSAIDAYHAAKDA